MNPRQLSLLAGVSYLVIFFAAIFANFIVLDAILSDPVGTVTDAAFSVRLGVMAFLVAAVFDVIVAWALFELYKDNVLSRLSTYFRIIHAVLMGGAVYALLATLPLRSEAAILEQVTTFNNLWLIGLFFFGVHLLLLARIVRQIRIIPWFLAAAGVMYIVDTTAHFTFANYAAHTDTFLMLVAVPAILGEMSFSLWLLFKGSRSMM